MNTTFLITNAVGEALAGKRLNATPTGVFTHSGSIIEPKTITTTTDSAGNVVLDLLAGTYTITVIDGDVMPAFIISVPESGGNASDMIVQTANGTQYVLPLETSDARYVLKTGTVATASYCLVSQNTLGSIESASYATYAVSSSYALNAGDSNNSVTSSLAEQVTIASTNVGTYPIPFISSTSGNATIYGDGNSNLNWDSANSILIAPTFQGTSSWSQKVLSSSYAPIEPNYSASVSTQLGTKQATLTNTTYTITASYSTTASFALNAGSAGTTLVTGSTYTITSSWAEKAITSSYALNAGSGGTTLSTGSTYPITSSKALSAISASYSSGSIIGEGLYKIVYLSQADYDALPTKEATVLYVISGSNLMGSYDITASWASQSLSASYAPSSPSVSASYASFALSASYAVNGGSGGSGGTTLATGSTYPITSSWSNTAVNVKGTYISSSAVLVAGPSVGPYYSQIVVIPAGLDEDTAISVESNRNGSPQRWFFGSGTGIRPLTASANNNFRIVDLTAANLPDRLNIADTTGYVGINTGYPVAMLDVRGDISASAINVVSITASAFSGTITSASYAITSSYSLNAGSGGTTLSTGSTYPITSSWSNNAISASWAPSVASDSASFASMAMSASYSTGSIIGYGVDKAIVLTQEEYNALTTPDENTIYYITTGSTPTYEIVAARAVSASYADGAIQGVGITKQVALTQAQYDALGNWDDTTMYFISASSPTYDITSSWSEMAVTASYVSESVVGAGIYKIQSITQAAYDALGTPNPTTLYVITS